MTAEKVTDPAALAKLAALLAPALKRSRVRAAIEAMVATEASARAREGDDDGPVAA